MPQIVKSETLSLRRHPSGVGLPKGQTFHAAGGWTAVVVHESKESWERFRNDTLMPKLQQGVKGQRQSKGRGGPRALDWPDAPSLGTPVSEK